MRRAVDGGPRLWGRRIGDGTLTWPVNGMASRPPRIALGAGLVLLAHGLLWVGLSAALRTPPAARQAAATPPPLWLRWVRDPLPDAARPVALPRLPGPAAKRQTNRAPSPSARPSLAPAGPQPITLTPTEAAATQAAAGVPQADTARHAPPSAAAGGTAAITAEPAASPPTPTAPPRLNLALPTQRQPPPPAAAARDDTRVNLPRPDRDERLAAALGTDTTLRMARHGERLRFRQGRDCIDVLPSREAELNPFNQSTHPTPRQARACD